MVKTWTSADLCMVMNRICESTQARVDLEFEELLRASLHSPYSEVRCVALRGLRESDDCALALRAVAFLTSDESPEVRFEATTFLSSYCDAAAEGKLPDNITRCIFEGLKAAIESDEEKIKRAALESIAPLAPLGGEMVRERICAEYEKARQTKNASLRAISLRAMGRSGDVSFLSDVLHDLGNPSAEVRLSSVFALGELGSETHLSLLSELLDDYELDVQMAVVSVLGNFPCEYSRVMLLRLTKSPQVQLARFAQEKIDSILAMGDLHRYIEAGGLISANSSEYIPLLARNDGYNPDETGKEGWGHLTAEGEYSSKEEPRDSDDPFDPIIDYEKLF